MPRSTHAHQSQKRIAGDVALDLRPLGARAAKDGQSVVYFCRVKNLRSRKTTGLTTWHITVQVDPAVAFVFVERALSALPLLAQETYDCRFDVEVGGAGFEAGREVEIVFTVRREGAAALTVRRWFTTLPSRRRR